MLRPLVVKFVLEAIDAAARQANDQPFFLKDGQTFFHLILAQVEDRVAVRFLIAAGRERVQGKRISVGGLGCLLLFDEHAKNAAFEGRKRLPNLWGKRRRFVQGHGIDPRGPDTVRGYSRVPSSKFQIPNSKLENRSNLEPS